MKPLWCHASPGSPASTPGSSLRTATANVAHPIWTAGYSAGDLDDAVSLGMQLEITTQAKLERVVQRYFSTQRTYGAQELFFERIIDGVA